MSDSIKSKIKFTITLIIIVLFLWFLVISPMLQFRANEKVMEEAADRYFELNVNQLPTGERIRTLKLKELYRGSYMKEDLKIPYSNKACSIENSWIKVKRVNGEYKYYTYLECGVLSSNVDHKGPEIKVNGDLEMTINKGDEYRELGVKSVVDNSDGKIDVKNVDISGKVNTSKVGTYTVEYAAVDSLSNKTTVKRKVTVVQRLAPTIKKALGNSEYYVGNPKNNYIYFSNMLFRIVGLDGDNVRIISEQDVANVNYNGIDDWFKYYEKHLTDKAKKMIVESKFCNMKLTKNSLDTTQCTAYTDKKKFGLVSAVEINKADTANGNYLIDRGTLSWTANEIDEKQAYVSGINLGYMGFDKVHNFGVSPMFDIDGRVLIVSGKGTKYSPYKLEDYAKAQTGNELNTRYSGEFVKIDGELWRIVDVQKDGTTKVIKHTSLQNVEIYYDNKDGLKQYNPTEKGNIGYIINNRITSEFTTKYFVNHEIKVPIYKTEPQYKQEVKTEKYTVKVSAPNMYEMFSAATVGESNQSSWFLNSSLDPEFYPAMSDSGAVMYGVESTAFMYSVRPIGYVKSTCVITSGKGTEDEPFVIRK